MAEISQSFEIAIVGAGPAGLAAGLHLSATGHEVVIINRPQAGPPTPRSKVGECLAPACLPILERLKIRDLVSTEKHLASPGNLSSWGHDGLASLDFIHHPYGHGWHLDRVAFEADLARRAESSGCRIVQANVRKAALDDQRGWTLELDASPGRIEGRFALDASGRSSFLAHAAGARRVRHDPLVAVYSFLETAAEAIPDATALVESRPEGWWYSALLPDGRLSIAYMTDPDLLQASGGASRTAWEDRLRETVFTKDRVIHGRYRLVEDPRVTPAGSAILDHFSGSTWLACGDAAASYDPLSSHGIATALATGYDAAEAIIDWLDGNLATRVRYEDRIRRSFDYYLSMKTAYYAQEQRWGDLPFWRRRNGVS